ncbi:MAG: hypothetical protein BIFFINMI_03385 [Phycisphaerae bacterium]|nr:hypothetical protein [Phycisphaerae bacterium]
MAVGAALALLAGLARGDAPAMQPATPTTQPQTHRAWLNLKPDKPISRPATPSNVYVIPIDGEINDITLTLLKRMSREAIAAGADMLILRINTWGGLVTSALDISSYIKSDEQMRKVWTVAYVAPKAISAGSLIAMAADEIVMLKNGRFGDCAPISMGGKLTGVEREKIESPLRQEFRDSAKHNGYDPLLAEALVTSTIAVYIVRNEQTGEELMVNQAGLEERTRPAPSPWRQTGTKMLADGLLARVMTDSQTGEARTVSDAEAERLGQPVPSSWVKVRTVVDEDRLLTMTDAEAMEYGFVKGIVTGDAGLREFYHVQGSWHEMHQDFGEVLAEFLCSMWVRAGLFLIMLLGIWVELHTPGVGLPGAVALGALALLLAGPYLSGLADWWEIGLILLGLLLIGLEIFVIPGFGVTGVLGIIFFLTGLIFAAIPPNFNPSSWQPWQGGADTMRFLRQSLMAVVVGLIGFMVGAVLLSRYLRRLPVVGRVFLRDVGDPRLKGKLVPTAPPNPPGSGLEHLITSPPVGSRERLGLQLGQEGEVVATLRPAGKVRFGKRTVEAVADGEFLEPGRRVRITRFVGNNVVVAPVGPGQA